MPRTTTLNEDKGKQISDLEALLIMMDKLLENRLEQKPKAGITLAKGKPSERRVKYTQARKFLRTLDDYFGSRGCLSIGVCQTCTQLDQRANGNKAFGTCKRTGKSCHVWDTCPEHSKKGGGYGT